MWVVISKTEHTKVKTLEEATNLLTIKARETSPDQIRIITLEEYNNWEGRIRKRGNKSK